MINRIVTPLFAAGLSLAAFAQDLPQPSPLSTVEQTVGLTKVKVTYSRPSMKGRPIFGALVPFDQVWRTGANKATRIELDDELSFNGQSVPAGTYAIFTRPGKGSWEVMLNKNPDQSGTGNYKPEEDLLTLKLPAEDCERTETFTIEFTDVTPVSAVLQLRWEGVKVAIPLKTDPTPRAMANIDRALKEGKPDFNAYNRMARYCVDNGARLPEALDWAQQSVAMEKHYYNVYTLALAQAANGKTADAVTTGGMALELARKEGDAATAAQITDKMKEWSNGKKQH